MVMSIAVPECDDPPVALNIFVDVSENPTEGDEASYSCTQRYKLVGDDTLVCKNGQWKGTPPQCKGMMIIYYLWH